MDAPQSKRFKELRRQNGAVSGAAVRASLKSRREGLLTRIFRIGGKKYEVSAVQATGMVPAVTPVKK